MESAKLQTIKNWLAPKKFKEIKRYIGFAKFKRRFIYEFRSIVTHLTDSTIGGANFFAGIQCDDYRRSHISIYS